MVLHAGFTDALLCTADGAEEMTRGSLPGLPAAVDFGTGEAEHSFALYRKLRPEGPYFCAEYWSGWFDHWGAKHEHTDATKQVAEVRWMLQQRYSVSMYMLFGGTSFGWFSGANSNGHDYQPDVTSYDYDAPMDEAGQPRPKFFEISKAIQEVTGVTPPAVPSQPILGSLPPISLTENVSLWEMLPAPISSPRPLTMEELGQDFGYVLYSTTLRSPVSGDLVLDQLHSYARIYLDHELVGVLDRRLGKMTLPLTVADTGKERRLDILVENSGRVNFTAVLRTEQAGITHSVTLAGKPITGWKTYTLPFTNPGSASFKTTSPKAGPTLFRGAFSIGKPTDTFLDLRAYGKGQVWVNGHALGRYWRIGPQGGLYLPGAWLHPGRMKWCSLISMAVQCRHLGASITRLLMSRYALSAWSQYARSAWNQYAQRARRRHFPSAQKRYAIRVPELRSSDSTEVGVALVNAWSRCVESRPRPFFWSARPRMSSRCRLLLTRSLRCCAVKLAASFCGWPPVRLRLRQSPRWCHRHLPPERAYNRAPSSSPLEAEPAMRRPLPSKASRTFLIF
jgi:hypothetical protein